MSDLVAASCTPSGMSNCSSWNPPGSTPANYQTLTNDMGDSEIHWVDLAAIFPGAGTHHPKLVPPPKGGGQAHSRSCSQEMPWSPSFMIKEVWNLGSLIFSENTSRNKINNQPSIGFQWNLTFPIGCMTNPDPRWPWAPTSWKIDTLNLLICNICTFPVTPCDCFPNARSAVASENCNFETKNLWIFTMLIGISPLSCTMLREVKSFASTMHPTPRGLRGLGSASRLTLWSDQESNTSPTDGYKWPSIRRCNKRWCLWFLRKGKGQNGSRWLRLYLESCNSFD